MSAPSDSNHRCEHSMVASVTLIRALVEENEKLSQLLSAQICTVTIEGELGWTSSVLTWGDDASCAN